MALPVYLRAWTPDNQESRTGIPEVSKDRDSSSCMVNKQRQSSGCRDTQVQVEQGLFRSSAKPIRKDCALGPNSVESGTQYWGTTKSIALNASP